MYRNGAIISLVIGVALTFSLAFTSFDKQLNQWLPDENGNPERVAILCPTPWSIVVGDAELDMQPAWYGRECTPTARLLFFEGAVVALTALALATRGFVNGPRPPTIPIEVLPSLERLGST